MKNIDLHEFIKEDIAFFEQEQIAVFKEKENRIEVELKQIAEQLVNFEDKFFADL